MVDLAHCGLQDRLPPQEGMLKFLEQIGFSHWTGAGEKKFEGSVFDRSVYDNWNYKQDYTRNSGLAAWLDTQVGKASMHAAIQGTRQRNSDFDMQCVIEVTKDVGTTVAAMDPTVEYLKQSLGAAKWCGAVPGGSKWLCLTPFPKDWLRQILTSDRAEATRGRFIVEGVLGSAPSTGLQPRPAARRTSA